MNPTEIQGQLELAKTAVDNNLKGKYPQALIDMLFQGFSNAYVAIKQFEVLTGLKVKVTIE